MDEKLQSQIAFLDSQIDLREKEIAKVDQCELELVELERELDELKVKVALKQDELSKVKESKDKFIADIETLQSIKDSLLPVEKVEDEPQDEVQESFEGTTI